MGKILKEDPTIIFCFRGEFAEPSVCRHRLIEVEFAELDQPHRDDGGYRLRDRGNVERCIWRYSNVSLAIGFAKALCQHDVCAAQDNNCQAGNVVRVS